MPFCWMVWGSGVRVAHLFLELLEGHATGLRHHRVDEDQGQDAQGGEEEEG